MNNPFKGQIIEFHILQSFPVSCLNRDDVGSPKSAVVGGVERARVSSQCWKSAVRLAMQDYDIKLGIRSRKLTEYVAKACVKLGATDEQSKACGDAIAESFSKDTIFFFSDNEANEFALYASNLGFDATLIKDKEIHKVSKKVLNPAVDGLDIALFGRMVAQAPELNVEAASSFNHALSTHKIRSELDFFTALDDLQETQGAGHLGTTEYNSATYYRYVSLNLGQLYQALDGEGLSEAIDAFTKALFVAVPSARQTTMAAYCPWNFAKVLVRKGQRIQVPFETAVKSKDGGFLEPSIEVLKSELTKVETMYGSLYGRIAEYTIGEDAAFNIDSLLTALKSHTEV
jgi:CRISPR system Cascade subunit CasC